MKSLLHFLAPLAAMIGLTGKPPSHTPTKMRLDGGSGRKFHGRPKFRPKGVPGAFGTHRKPGQGRASRMRRKLKDPLFGRAPLSRRERRLAEQNRRLREQIIVSKSRAVGASWDHEQQPPKPSR